MEKADLYWKQYQLNIDLYRGYLELVLKMNGFYYAVTGAIVSYYFAHEAEPLMRWSLLLPLIMSLALAVFFSLAAWAATVPRKETFELRDALGLKAAPEIGFLILLLAISAALMLIVAGGLAWVVWCR